MKFSQILNVLTRNLCAGAMLVAFTLSSLLVLYCLAMVISYHPLKSLVTSALIYLWFAHLWPNVRDDGRRFMVYFPDGSRSHYHRRCWALLFALIAHIRNPNRKRQNFPMIEPFWESHLPF